MSDGTAARAEALVREFWRRMASNDFDSIVPLLAAGFVLDWPQSNERIRGAGNFARLNAEYPAHGPWRFHIDELMVAACGQRVVSRVYVSDGVQHALAISFFELSAAGHCITRLVEFWPDRYAPPSGRAHLTEPLDANDTDLTDWAAAATRSDGPCANATRPAGERA